MEEEITAKETVPASGNLRVPSTSVLDDHGSSPSPAANSVSAHTDRDKAFDREDHTKLDTILTDLPSASHDSTLLPASAQSQSMDDTFVSCISAADVESNDSTISAVPVIDRKTVTEYQDSLPSVSVSAPVSDVFMNDSPVIGTETVKLPKTNISSHATSEVSVDDVTADDCMDETASSAFQSVAEVLDAEKDRNSSVVTAHEPLEKSNDCPMYDLPEGTPASHQSESSETIFCTPESQASSIVSPTKFGEPQAQKTSTDVSPSKRLTSLVEYEESSDSDEDMASDSEGQATHPSNSNTAGERTDEPSYDQDGVTLPPTSSTPLSNGTSSVPLSNGITSAVSSNNENEIPVIDLRLDNYRYTIDLGSGTDDSESDSGSSDSSSSSSSVKEVQSSSSEESSLSEDEAPPEKSRENESISADKSKERVKPKSKKPKRNPLLTQGELTLEDLPPIEDLKITVPEDQVKVIGYIFNIVERQVVVQGHPDIPPIDLDSVLFLDHGKKMLGRVFDVFGQVQEPLYVVRFNSSDHVKEHEVKTGELVYFAPATDHTNYVVVAELMRMKGSDASGLAGNEMLPAEVSDFSDDEEEARAKGITKQNKVNKFQSSTGEFQSNKKRTKASVQDRGRGRGRGRGNDFPNPFSHPGMRPRFQNQMDQRPRMERKFHPRFPNGGPPQMSRPSRFSMQGSNFGSRPVSPFPNQFEMKPRLDMNGRPCMGNPGPSSSFPSDRPGPWSQPRVPHHQFGTHTPFHNQQLGPAHMNGEGIPPPHTPPLQMQGPYPSQPPTPTPPPFGNFQNVEPREQPTPPPPYQSFSPRPPQPTPFGGPPPFQNAGMPGPSQSPHCLAYPQNTELPPVSPCPPFAPHGPPPNFPPDFHNIPQGNNPGPSLQHPPPMSRACMPPHSSPPFPHPAPPPQPPPPPPSNPSPFPYISSPPPSPGFYQNHPPPYAVPRNPNPNSRW